MTGLNRRYLDKPRCMLRVLQHPGHFIREAEGPVLRRKQKALPHLLIAFRTIHSRSFRCLAEQLGTVPSCSLDDIGHNL